MWCTREDTTGLMTAQPLCDVHELCTVVSSPYVFPMGVALARSFSTWRRLGSRA